MVADVLEHVPERVRDFAARGEDVGVVAVLEHLATPAGGAVDSTNLLSNGIGHLTDTSRFEARDARRRISNRRARALVTRRT